MRKITFMAAVFCLLLGLVACNPFHRHSRSFMNFSLPGNEHRLVINGNDMSMDISYSGEIEFNDEETAIEKMSPGSYLEYNKNGKRLFAEVGASGEVVYQFYNGSHQNEEGNGQKFLAEAVHEMISQGLFSKGRIERLYLEGGIPLVLSEARKIKADHVKRMYFEYVLNSDNITKEDLAEISGDIKLINSDNEKRQILEKMPMDHLKDTVTAQAYFAAIESIGSDNDKANTLKKTMRQSLTSTQFDIALQVAATINSDNDKANLLKEIIRNGSFPEKSFKRILLVTATVQSDNDKAEVLKTLMEHEIFDGDSFDSLLEVVSSINSDNDKANVFKKLASRPLGTERQWIGLINATSNISSDNDKANVLLEISKKMQHSEGITAAYMKTAKTINSEHDYQRVVKDIQ